MKFNGTKAKYNNNITIIVFNLIKILPTPVLLSNEIGYYKRQL